MPIEILKRDHRKVKELFIDLGDEKDFDDKKRLAERIFKNFETHAKIEEELFYPEVRSVSMEGKKMIEESIQEHNKVRGYINELRDFDGGLVEYENKVREMQQVIDDHVAKEENIVFPFSEKNIGEKLNLGLSAKIMAMKAREMI